jgi:hypothetical protein
MKRRLRPSEDLDQFFADDPALKRLYDALNALDKVTVQPDGTGSGLFKVYLSNRMGQYEAFLWINQTLHRSYVQWLRQADFADQCRDLWGPVVKNRSNPDGSELKRDIDHDTIIRITQQYASIATS